MSTSPVVSPRSLEALEFPQTLALIAELAATDLGGRRLLALRPVRGDRLQRRRSLLEGAGRLVADGPLVPPLEEPLETLERMLAASRPDLDGKMLLSWSRLLSVSGALIERTRAAEGVEGLSALVEDLADLAELRHRIDRTFDERGEVLDDASPRLKELRRKVNRQRQAAYKGLRLVLDAQGELFSEDTTPLHNGRLVVLLRASDRGRTPGLVHGRSSSGRSLYFEPLSVVEHNNALQEAIDAEEEERRRLLVELCEALLNEAETLQQHLDLVARMDALQAVWRFGELSDGRLVELSDGDLELVEARHPLLDPATVELRRRALGSAGHDGPVTPLDLSLDGSGRVLVVTGPNAGGKTVALKTVGLLTALHQTGLPVPTGAGSRLPLVDALVAVVGDEQDLLRDRSTFSGRLLRLQEAWNAATDSALILLDELGSGTDPQEGSALSRALIERLVEAGSKAVVTTHLLELASAALDLEGASCAAMEFDRDSGRPTYRLQPGPPGTSEAIALARQLGLPEAWLRRASTLLGPEHRTLTQMLAEVETLRAELEDERASLAREQRLAERERAELASESASLAAERRDLAKRQKRELAEFRRRVRRELQQEIDRLAEELKSGKRRGVVEQATERLFRAAPEIADEGDDGPPVTPGARVRHREYEWQGVVDRLDDGEAEVMVHGKRVRCPASSLSVVTTPQEASRPARVEVRHEEREVGRELKLLGYRVEEALNAVDGYLDQAVLAGLAEVRLVHGHGSGRLRGAVRDHLRRHPSVRDFRPGKSREGGDGATVVILNL